MQSFGTGALEIAPDQACKEWNRKPVGALAYGSMGGARAPGHLRLTGIRLQVVLLRNAASIGAGDFFKVSLVGYDPRMSETEGNLEGSLNARLAELTWCLAGGGKLVKSSGSIGRMLPAAYQ